MTEAVEVAIELALLDRAQAFALEQNLPIALPNIKFTPPVVSQTAKYLRATILPADTITLPVGSGSDQHYGLFQMDVFFGAGGGEIAPKRIAAAIVSYFIRGTKMISNGFTVSVLQTPRIGPQINAPDGVWTSLPVRIPYQIFAIPA
jgi:hypothetical protein